MDLSQEYIKMCRNAFELQKGHARQSGDFYVDYRCNEVLIWLNEYEGESIDEVGEYWDDEFCDIIFRQDQLQGISQCTTQIRINNEIEPIYKIKWELHWTNAVYADTLEKCWLKHVMLENYNKEWNGERWVSSQQQ